MHESASLTCTFGDGSKHALVVAELLLHVSNDGFLVSGMRLQAVQLHVSCMH